MTTKVFKRMKDGSGDHFRKIDLSDSVVEIFPAAVQTAAKCITYPEARAYRDFLYSLGATPDGLLNAIKFYEDYFKQLLEHTALEVPYESFKEAGLPEGDISFLLFQSSVAASMLSTYHEDQVAYGSEEVEWRENAMKATVEYLERLRNMATEGMKNEMAA